MTESEIALELLKKLKLNGFLYQEEAVDLILELEQARHLYENRQGNYSICRNILSEFRLLTPNVIWERGSRMWRFRQDGDPEGRADV